MAAGEGKQVVTAAAALRMDEATLQRVLDGLFKGIRMQTDKATLRGKLLQEFVEYAELPGMSCNGNCGDEVVVGARICPWAEQSQSRDCGDIRDDLVARGKAEVEADAQIAAKVKAAEGEPK